MHNLKTRIISALVALVALFGTIYYWKADGIYIIGILVVLRSSYEMARMLFKASLKDPIVDTSIHPISAQSNVGSKIFFVLICFVSFVFLTKLNIQNGSSLITLFILVSTVCYGIFSHEKIGNIELVFTFISKSVLGIIYCSFLPATMIWITHTPNGIHWFFCLLAVVFAGDNGAYLFGKLFGKTKIAPMLSPQKSLQGSVGGVIFSLVAALGFYFVIPGVPVWIFLICGLFGGILGQIGDFFESLIKRIAGVKDSGSIMPGHGGVLDRLDGVFMAAPLFFWASSVAQNILQP